MEKEQHKSFFLSVFALLKENLYDNNREKLSEFDIQNTGMGRWLNKRKTVIGSDNGLDNGN